CAAVGYYTGSDRAGHALLVAENGGTWGPGIDAQLPPDAATTFPLPDEAPGGFLSSVSCPSTGSCSAVGSYARQNSGGGTYGTYPWLLGESGGQWAAQGQSLELPADAASEQDYRSATSPFLGFTGLSCSSVGNCTAVGGYVDHNHHTQGVFFTERSGKWSQGIKVPVPAGA